MAPITWGAPSSFASPSKRDTETDCRRVYPAATTSNAGLPIPYWPQQHARQILPFGKAQLQKLLATRPNWGKSAPVHECSDWVFFVKASISFSSIVARQGEPKEHNQRQKHSETRARHNSYRNLEPEHQLSSTYDYLSLIAGCWFFSSSNPPNFFLWQQLWQQLPGHSKDKAPKKLATKL